MSSSISVQLLTCLMSLALFHFEQSRLVGLCANPKPEGVMVTVPSCCLICDSPVVIVHVGSLNTILSPQSIPGSPGI